MRRGLRSDSVSQERRGSIENHNVQCAESSRHSCLQMQARKRSTRLNGVMSAKGV